MSALGFKSEETLALWQWMVLGGFSLILIGAAVVARWYGLKQRKLVTASSWWALFKPQVQSQPLNVDFQQVILSRQAKLYHLTIDGKRHCIFETERGLVELSPLVSTLADQNKVD